MRLEPVRIIDDDGNLVDRAREPALAPAEARRVLETMLIARWLDERILRLQRQGRIGFYVTALGEEAVAVAAAAALRPGDWIYSSYREVAAALYRGYPLRTLLCQLFGNAEDPLHGRQMPIHHSIRALNFASVSSPVGTQIPHAVGTAMAARMLGKSDIALAFFGDGATSTGVFHAACTFAGVRKAPCVLLCRNNGWGISTPRALQSATATLAEKAVAYGMPGVLVDGNDALAVYQVTVDAAERARGGGGPTLIEARTYRRGAHSSSDDPSVYRDPDEPTEWEAHDPIVRLRRFLERRNLWKTEDERLLLQDLDRRFAETLTEVERLPPPALETMFTDVYADVPWHLREQSADLAQALGRETSNRR